MRVEPAIQTEEAPALTGWAHSFRALRHRDFRLFLAGQAVSLSGSWMQNLAQLWLVYRLTHSTVLMGTLGFCMQVPVLVLGPLAGAVADRHRRRKLVIVAQFLLMLQAFVMAWLTLSGRVTVTHVLLLATVFGVIATFEIPARQSLFVHLVGERDLANAIALNSMTFNVARLVGPSIGGFFVAAFGEGLCFLANGLTFLAVIGSLVLIRPAEPVRHVDASAMLRIAEGFRYCWRAGKVRRLLAATGLVNFSVAPLIVLGPVFADAIFGRGSSGLGLLTGGLGLGAAAGTFFIARLREKDPLFPVVLRSSILVGGGLILFAASPYFVLSVAAMALVGFNVFRQLVATNTLIQSLISDDYRGRVMAIYSMMVIGMLPIGSLFAGWAAVPLGARGTVLAGSLLALLAGAALRRNPASYGRPAA